MPELSSYELVESDLYPGHWHVEAIDNEGRIFVAVFSGPDAEARATEYADWKNKPLACEECADLNLAAARCAHCSRPLCAEHAPTHVCELRR